MTAYRSDSLANEIAELREQGQMKVLPQAGEGKSYFWESNFGNASPLQVYDALADGFPGFKLSVMHADEGNGALMLFEIRDNLRRKSTTFATGAIGFDNTANPSELILHDFHVDPLRQGAGTAKILLRNIREFMGLEEIDAQTTTIDATQVGSYTWMASGGFVPYEEDWKNKIRPEAEERLNDIVKNEGGKHRGIGFAREILKSNDPKDAYHLAHIGGSYASTSDRLKSMTLGQRTLVNLRWEGVMDREDKDCMQRLDTFIASGTRSHYKGPEV